MTSRSGPVRLLATSRACLRPVDGAALQRSGFWADRQRLNHDVLLPQGEEQLELAGAFANLHRLIAGTDEAHRGPLFQDSDLYKWLEALGWELGRQADTDHAGTGRADAALADTGPANSGLADSDLAISADAAIRLIELAQAPDGYLNTRYQADPAGRFHDLQWSHELYCAGHLIQAGVAQARGRGDDTLLGVSRRFADYLVATFGPGPDQLRLFDGHPEIETALVELYRETGIAEYLELARFFIDIRGTGAFGPGAGRAYYQDHVAVRAARTVVGHAVRQLYLAAGATDLYLETGDSDLLAALRCQWDDMVGTKSYLTGGIGSRHEGEAFGDPYELPADRAYCETCAAIAAVQWAWRMLLATGEARYADHLERVLYNGFAVGFALDAPAYAYVNPLHVRTGAGPARRPWFECACCPPNVMRLLASLQWYLATSDEGGIQIHQYAPAELRVERAGFGSVVLRTETDYPWSPEVTVEVVAGGTDAWELALRIPSWCPEASVTVNGSAAGSEAARPVPGSDGVVRVRRSWQAGDQVLLRLPMTPRLRTAHPYVDAVRGCAAIERGPLVYCFEEVDHATPLDDLALVPSAALDAAARPELLGGTVVVTASGVRSSPPGAALYRSVADAPADGHPVVPGGDPVVAGAEPVALTAVPYHAWGNRTAGGMRVWLPVAGPGALGGAGSRNA